MGAKRSRATATSTEPNWDELRLLLAVVRGGSFLAAGHALHLSVSTVSRRMTTLERRTGTALFERRSDGAVPTEAGRALGDLALHVEAQLERTLQGVQSRGKALKGNIRLSIGDGFATALMDTIAGFSQLHPEVTFELMMNSEVASLHRREADLAIRTLHRREASLVYRRLGGLTYGLYAAPGYAERSGLPRSRSELGRHRFIGYAKPLHGHATVAFLRKLGVERLALRASSFRGQLLACERALGIAALPTVAAAGLLEVLPGTRLGPLPVYLVAHPEALRRPHVRGFVDRLAADAAAQLA